MMPYESHTAMAQGAEIADGFLDSFAVVYADVGDIFLRRSDVVECSRDTAACDRLDQMLFHFRNDDRQARYTKTNHELHAGEELFRTVVSIRDNDFEATGVSVGFQRAIDVQEKRILHVGNDDPQNAALASSERTRVQVWMVVELFGSLQHARARRGFDNFKVVEDARNRGRGDSRFLGDSIKIHGQRAPFAHPEHLNCSRHILSKIVQFARGSVAGWER